MMSRILRFFKLYWLPMVSGVLMGTSYIPLAPWALVFCFAPLWYFVLIRAQTWRQALCAGWITQFVLSAIGFHWIAYVSHEYGYLPWTVSLLTLVLFAATVHTYYALAAGLGFLARRHWNLNPGATLAIMIGTVSVAEAWWPSLFPWNLGYPWFFAGAPISQHADIIGFLGLSLVCHGLSGGLVWLYLKKSKAAWAYSLSAAVVLIALLSYTGQQKRQQWEKFDASLKVLQIQANIANLDKLEAEKGRAAQQSIIDDFFSLTRQAVQKHPETELIIWPETAFPDALDNHRRTYRYAAQFFQFIQEIGRPILTGAYAEDAPGPRKQKMYNGVFLFNGKGEALSEPYHKTFLLAYGEYTPFSQTFPWMAKLSPAGEGFGRGDGPMVMPLGDSLVGLQVCYESLYPFFTEGLSKKGAQWLVNLTNDSWFGPTFEPHQHMYMTLARAVESRRPLIRSTNTGFTTAILASGEILQRSPLFEKWFGLFDIRYIKNPPQTFYVKYGSWLPWLVLGIMALCFVFGKEKKPWHKN